MMGKVISPTNGGNYIGVIYNARILTFDPNMDTYQYREDRYLDPQTPRCKAFQMPILTVGMTT